MEFELSKQIPVVKITSLIPIKFFFKYLENELYERPNSPSAVVSVAGLGISGPLAVVAVAVSVSVGGVSVSRIGQVRT